jgi:thiamine biosynthesis lipoprotein ApbE
MTGTETPALARRRRIATIRRGVAATTLSELSRFNADPRATVPVSLEMARFAAAVRAAGELSGGPVDATLLGLVVFDDASFRRFPGSSKVSGHNGSRGHRRISLPRTRRR